MTENENHKYFKLVNSLSEILKPSIDESIYSKIEEVVFELIKQPNKLPDEYTINKLLNITNERVDLDRNVLKDKSQDIKKFIHLLVNEYEKNIIFSNDSSEEINRIKNDLNRTQISDHSNRELNVLYSKLTKVIYDIENNLDETKLHLNEAKDTCSHLENSVERLQADLEKLKKEKDIDFLTNVLNRRGYTSAIIQVENQFTSFNNNYAIVFIDIDDFKEINDTHGHDCGDVVLRTFATILKQTIRESDVISRYGGEEFVAIICYKNIEEVETFVNRIKTIVTKYKFVYTEEIKLQVGFSAGVAHRNKYNSYEDTMKFADILLYKAKHEGKGKVITDLGKVL